MIEAREIFDEEGYKKEQCMKNEIKRKRKSDYYHRHVKELCPDKRRIFFGNANPQKFINYRLKMKAIPEEERKMRNKERTERTREIRKKRYEEKKQKMSEEQKAIQRKKLAEYQRRRKINELRKKCDSNGSDITLIHNTNDFNRDAALVLVPIVENVSSEFDKATSIVNYTGSDCDAALVLVPIVEEVGSEFDKTTTSIVNYTGSDCDAALVLVPIVEDIGSNICVASNCDLKVNIVDDSDINRFDLSNNNNNYDGDDSSIADLLANEDRNISNNVTLYIHNALQSIMTNDDTMSAAQQLLRLQNNANNQTSEFESSRLNDDPLCNVIEPMQSTQNNNFRYISTMKHKKSLVSIDYNSSIDCKLSLRKQNPNEQCTKTRILAKRRHTNLSDDKQSNTEEVEIAKHLSMMMSTPSKKRKPKQATSKNKVKHNRARINVSEKNDEVHMQKQTTDILTPRGENIIYQLAGANEVDYNRAQYDIYGNIVEPSSLAVKLYNFFDDSDNKSDDIYNDDHNDFIRSIYFSQNEYESEKESLTTTKDYESSLYVDKSYLIYPHEELNCYKSLGLGLFTSIVIPKDNYIAQFYGTVTSSLSLPDICSHKIYLSKDVVLDCTKQRYAGTCLAAIINSPFRAVTSTLQRVRSNCRLVVDNNIAYIKSTKKIMEHDELLLNYGNYYKLDNRNVDYQHPLCSSDYWRDNKRCLIAYDYDKYNRRSPRKIWDHVNTVKIDGIPTSIRLQVRKLDVLSMGPTLCAIRDKIASIFASAEYQSVEHKFKTGCSSCMTTNYIV